MLIPEFIGNRFWRVASVVIIFCLSVVNLEAQLRRVELGIDVGTYQVLDKTKNIWNDGFLLRAHFVTSKNSGKKIMFWHGYSAFYSIQSNKPDTIFIDKTPLKYEFYIYGKREIVGINWRAKWWRDSDAPFSFYWSADVGIVSDSYSVIHWFPGVREEGGGGALSTFVSPSIGIQYARKNGFVFFLNADYQISYSYLKELRQTLNIGVGGLYRF
ncbi:MAG: hypothetical protein WBP41_13065 [Saprospiraceae bacterium]